MITIIAALTQDYVIGSRGGLPWDLPEDLKHFKQVTEAGVLIMGYRTFVSIGRPLPHRHNIVLSDKPLQIRGATVCMSIEEALKEAKKYDKEIFFIGGAMVFASALPIADRMILSWVKKDYAGDTYFPRFNEDEWDIESTEDYDDFEVVVYKRHK